MKALLYCLSILMLIACKSNTTTSQPENQNTPVVVTDTPVAKEESEVVPEPVIEKPVEDYKSLKFNVAIGISPTKPDWVLYKNGTYIIFPSGYTDTQMKTAAGDLLDSFNNQLATLDKSQFAKGWIGATSKGIYTFVSQESLGLGIHSDNTLINAAISNIQADKLEKEIVHINRKK